MAVELPPLLAVHHAFNRDGDEYFEAFEGLSVKARERVLMARIAELQDEAHALSGAVKLLEDDNDRLRNPDRERVARAIFDSDNDINPKTGKAYTWEQSPYHQPDYYRKADAAIAAMRGDG